MQYLEMEEDSDSSQHGEEQDDDELDEFIFGISNNNRSNVIAARAGLAPKQSRSIPTTTTVSSWVLATSLVGILVLLFTGIFYTGSDGLSPDDTRTSPGYSRSLTTAAAAAATAAYSRRGQEEETNDNDASLRYSKVSAIVPDTHRIPLTKETREEITTMWGKWKFWDGEEGTRPADDYCGKFPNRDIPGDQFPPTAWQADAVFVNHIVDAGANLVSRAMEAIFTEYGWGRSQYPPEKLPWLLGARLPMYQWDKVDLTTATQAPYKYGKRGSHGGGGWTTERSSDGLVRRLLHAMMTNDQFTVVLGGHSAAAGHGNHFHQSYMMQFHQIMAPVFARLGVKLVTRNLSQGGLGTIQNAMGMKSLYGDSIDLLLWDTSMTENNDVDIEYFLRQGLLSGKKVPVIWGGSFKTLQFLHETVDADVGFFGRGNDGLMTTTDENQVQTLPAAQRYQKCSKERQDLCNNAPRFCAKCWIERNDGVVTADMFQRISRNPGSQVRWHPGYRVHQLTGRALALSVLDALQVAIQIWSDGTMSGPPLDESLWHVTDYYENIRTKLKNLDPKQGYCQGLAERGLPLRLCWTAMEARSLFTPRANPHETSLINLLKGDKPPPPFKVLYDGPDAHNPCFDPPPGEVDVYGVVTNRRRLITDVPSLNSTQPDRVLKNDEIVPGKGWQHVDEYPGDCDGSYDAICGRHYEHDCPLIGHHDSRGALTGNEFSGWVVFNIPQVNEGLILIKLFTWMPPKSNTVTQDWTSVNNEGRSRLLLSHDDGLVTNDDDDNGMEYTDKDYIDGLPYDDQRRRKLVDYPENFEFDYAINGKITTLNKAEFIDRIKNVQRVVEIFAALDDPDFGPSENVEVALRLRGSGRAITFGITHIYWA